jgi:hypothetical protein
MNYQAKFNPGTWLRNRNTNEEGFVKRTYGAGHVVMYEMRLPNKGGDDYIADWNEKFLELASSELKKTATGPLN